MRFHIAQGKAFMTNYSEQVKGLDDQIDAEFWKNPTGIDVEFDTLKFLYVPDHVMTFIAAQLARQVYRYQVDNIATRQQITHAVTHITTMAVERPMASATIPVSAGAKAAPVFSTKYSTDWAVLRTSGTVTS